MNKNWLNLIDEKKILLAILTLALLVFLPTVFFDFANYDDNIYLTSNEYIKNLTLGNVSYIFGHQFYGHYFPVTLIIHSIEYFFVGSKAGFYHFTNVLFHLLNISLLFYLLKKFKLDKTAIVFVSLIFALHPLNVEPVCWIGGRNNLVFTFFLLAAFHYYHDFLITKKKRFYFVCFGLFLLSCLSKSSAVVFPIMLIIYDWYFVKSLKSFKPITLLNKLPMLLVSVVIGLIAVKAANSFGSIEPVENLYSWYNRPFILSTQITFYFKMLVFPYSLNILYSNPEETLGILNFWVYCSIIIIPIMGLIIYYSPCQKISLFGLLLFLLNVGLTLKITVSTNVYAADRYAYTALPWLAISLTPYLNYFGSKISKYTILKPVAILIFVLFVVKTEARVWVWKNGDSLFSEMVNNASEQSKSFLFRGLNNIKLGKIQQAKIDFKVALALDSNYAKNYNAFATSLMLTNAKDSAKMYYNKAIQKDSTFDSPYFHLGNMYGSEGNYEQARSNFNKFLKFNPTSEKALFRLANIEVIEENYASALLLYNSIIERNPSNGDAILNRGFVNMKLDNIPEACNDWIKANELGSKEAGQMMVKYCLN